jgi:outer membrane protein OmpA-like peptidoglycan-associated protein
MTCDPIRWLWGLIPIAMLAWLAVHWHADAIERDLEVRSTRALTAAGHDWASVAFSGRHGLLIGTAERPEDAPAALAIVDDVWGVYVVEARVRIAGDDDPGTRPMPELPVAKGETQPPVETAEPLRVKLPPLTEDVVVLAGASDDLHATGPSVLSGKDEGPAALGEPNIEHVVAFEPGPAREDTGPAEVEVTEVATDVPSADAVVDAPVEAVDVPIGPEDAGRAGQVEVYGPAVAALVPDAGVELATTPAAEIPVGEAETTAVAVTTSVPDRTDETEVQETTLPAAAAPAADNEPVAHKDAADPVDEPSETVAEADRPAGDQIPAAPDKGEREPDREQETAAIAPETATPAAAPEGPTPKAPTRCTQDTELAKISKIVRFARGKADLDRGDRAVLNRIYRAMDGCPALALKVVGHTDADGAARRNMQLSLRRAKAAVTYLVDKGIDAGRLKAVGYGETRPVVPNDTADNRAKNRRVEVELTGPDGSAEPAGSENAGDD